MGNSTISIGFKVEDGANGLKTLSLQAADLQKFLSGAVSETQKLQNSFINFTAFSSGLVNLSASLQTLFSSITGLTQAYDAQKQVETQLAVNMRNTMGAREEDIQSIKDLCSAQQELGVIGDEVQLAGAQEMATYLSQKDSLETLIPVMNDMLAQQYGLNATQENAAQIASMLGKVMDGQTGALKRYGYSFTEAQEKVIKFGTEEERAAMLATIVSDSVGGMNKALAETNSGGFKQTLNWLGDIKEMAGEVIIGVMPFMTLTSQVLTSYMAISTFTNGIKTYFASLWKLGSALLFTTTSFIKNNTAALALSAGQKIMAVSTAALAAAQRVLNLVLSANPIGAVILAVTALVGALIYAYNNSEDFRIIVDKVWASVKSLGEVIIKGLAKAFEWLVEKCKVAWDWLKNILGLGGKKVELEVGVSTSSSPSLEELEKKYAKYEEQKKDQAQKGKIGISNEPIWTDAPQTLSQITGNIEVLNRELQNATKEGAAGLNKQIAELKEKADAIRNSGLETLFNPDASTLEEIENNIECLQRRLNKATIETAAEINKELSDWQQKADAIRGSSIEKPHTEELTLNVNARSLKEINDNIAYYNQELEKATSSDIAANINAQKKAWQDKADAIRNAGLETAETIDIMGSLKDGYGNIKSLGSGVESLTSALEGNRNAWQTLTGIVDAFMQIFEGITSFVKIIETLTGATQHQSLAKKEETADTIANTIATEADTAASIANTAAKSGEAVADATKSGASLPFPANIAAISAGVAAVMAALAMVGGFATGGIVPGTSTSGDKVLARVNSGEMILNKAQQQRLFRMINGQAPSMPNVALPGHTSAQMQSYNWNGVFEALRASVRPATPVVIGGSFRVSGRDLVCALANETRISSKSGQRTNIKI